MQSDSGLRTAQRFVALAAALGATGVVLGAFGAHALKDRLELAGTLALWETGVRYQVWHALALLALGALRPAPAARWIAAGFAGGALLFAGSLYGLALGGPAALLGPMTPLGGLLLTAAWVGMAALAVRGRLVDPGSVLTNA